VRGRMKRLALLAGIIAILSATRSWAGEGQSTGNINYLFGSRTYLSDDWFPVQKQPSVDIRFDYRPNDWPLNWMIGYAASSEEAAGWTSEGTYGPAKGSFSELYAGGVKYFDWYKAFNPYVGAGLSVFRAEVSMSAILGRSTRRSSTMGYFLNAGVMGRLGPLNIGIDTRVLTGIGIAMWVSPGLADNIQTSLAVGYNW